MSDDEDDIIIFGTPLPEIEDETTLKKKAAKELQVRDEKGRQRFHGAFTGGFSAGYFNTVGTKEGWAPSSFVSSRDKKSDGIQQNPEDFMDDEDFGEFGIATRKIHTTTNFQDLSDRKDQKRKFIDSDSAIPGEAPLKDLVQPVRESIGIIILKKLGWREGQGIGPRVKKASKEPKVYGCSPFPDKNAPEEDDPMATLFTFAPEDTESTSYKSKDNYFGLGYTGLSKQSVLNAPIDPFAPTSTKSWLAKDKRKLRISGQAFGVGALEEDDEDIYGKDDMSQYDFSELEIKRSEDSHKAIEAPKHTKSPGVLDGFHLAKHPPLVKEYFPPPTLPPNFIPQHLKTICVTPLKPSVSQSRHSLSASDRSLILGERKFQKVSANDPPEARKAIDQMHPETSSTSSSFFRPFSNDKAKQQRYEEYLKLRQTGDVTKFVQPLSMTEWEKQQELEEFSKAAVFYKPLSNALSSRFESRSNLSAEQEVMAALEKIKKAKERKQAIEKKCLVGKSNRKTFEWHPVSLLCKRMNVPNPYPNSDSSGAGKVFPSKSVFSHLNFGFENLESSSKSDSSLPAKSTSSTVKTSESNTDLPDEILNPNTDSTASDKNSKETVSAKSDEGTLFEGKRPPMDFFKDIFENSSSDEDDQDEEKLKESDGNNFSKRIAPESKNEEENLKNDSILQKSSDKEATITVNEREDHSTVVTQNSSGKKKVGFGVFANLDLDALNQRPVAKPLCSNNSGLEDKILEKSAVNSNAEEHTEAPKAEDKYGPQLPPNYSVESSPVPLSISSDSFPRKHSKSKSKHKHKHHKHKHKKKKKKSSKRESSSGDSSIEELDDIPPSLIIEKMKKLQKKKF